MWSVIKPAESPTAETASWEELRQAYSCPDTRLWVDLESPTVDDLKRLDAVIDLDDSVLGDCLTGEPRPRIDDYGDYLLIVAYGVILPDQAANLESRKLAIFRGKRFLVTIHTQPSRSVADLRQRCRTSSVAVFAQGLDSMVYRLIDGMVDRYLAILDDYDHRVETLEEQANNASSYGAFLTEAAASRRQLIELRRLIGGQRGLIEPLAEGDFDYLSDEISRRFRTVRSHLLHAHDRVVGLLERLVAAGQNYNSVVAMRTNEVVRTLTVFTAVILPMSLIAGVYGMNFPTWPTNDSPVSFWAVVALMAATGGVTLAVFKWLRWL